MVDSLQDLFHRIDVIKSKDNKPTGKFSKKSLMVALRKFFPTKSDERFERLKVALSRDQPGNSILYAKLFMEDAEGNQGYFAEEVRDQHVNEREDYIEEIEEAIREFDTDRTGEAPVSDIRKAMTSIDPKKPEQEINLYIARGVGTTVSEIKENRVTRISTFIKKLSMGIVKRSTKPVSREDIGPSQISKRSSSLSVQES
eukprot:TRINITY_DN3124_c0_g1_i2.p1 TRINITY_DN3124_c0_g1~~TRINITY_DN3124_c0_g1_i2.p1  ORF type:complete len:207 (+),score=42.09 TRINITY_DN3124_c0_g1_i2:23-622(+)